MSDWENEIVIDISEKGAAATDKALKDVIRSYESLKRLTSSGAVNPLGVGAGSGGFAASFTPQAMQEATGALHHFGIEYEAVRRNMKSPLSGGDKSFADAFTKGKNGLDKLTDSAARAKNGFREAASELRVFRTLLITVGVEKFASAIIHGTDELTNLENKIKVVLKDNESLGYTMERLTAVANSTRTGIAETATIYSRTARAVEDLGLSQSSTLEFTKVLNQAVKVGGSTAVESAQSMIQLSQGLASGSLKGDELRSVLEGMPVVSKLIADHLGIATGELRKWGSEGKIVAEDVMAALIEGGDKIQEKFDQMTPTFEQSWEVLKNNWIVGLKMFQPLVEGVGRSLDWFTQRWEDLGTTMEDVFKVWIKHRDEGFFSRLASVFTENGEGTNESRYEMLQRKHKEAAQALEDEDMIQKGNAMADMYDAMENRKDKPQKGHKEGGLTFQELVEKMRQEQEVASMTPFEGGVTKEFFQKMGELKKSIREGLIAGAGKGGKADEQLQQLQQMIRLEHELAEAQKFVAYWDEKIAEEKKKRAEAGIAAGKHEAENQMKARQQIDATNRSIEAALDPFSEYNSKINDFNTYLHSHKDQLPQVTKEVEKMGTAYKTFAPVFDQMADGLADAAANALVFGNNFSTALKQIAQASAASMISGLIKVGVGALLGTPMPGINGGNQLTPPAHARGGYVRGFEYGGYTGSYARGDIAGVVHGQEFVVNANATARNRAMLESMNSGRPVAGTNVNIHNYAGVAVEAHDSGNGNIEVMIHKAIAERAPMAVAQDLRNRNGRVSKALRQNYEVTSRN